MVNLYTFGISLYVVVYWFSKINLKNKILLEAHTKACMYFSILQILCTHQI